MKTTPPRAGESGRPPRPQTQKLPAASWTNWGLSPYAAKVNTSPRVTRQTQEEDIPPRVHVPARPKRPLSASRVISTANSRRAQRPTSARTVRPASASQARYTKLETVAFPMQPSDHSGVCSPPLSSTTATAQMEPPVDANDVHQQQESEDRSPQIHPVALQAKLQALLELWEGEQPHFRSPALFCEATFSQARALAVELPRPNAFLSATAFASLQQMSCALEDQYPFFCDVVRELGSIVYANFPELQQQQESTGSHARLFFQHGKPWFQELATQKQRTQSLRVITVSTKDEIRLLTHQLREAQAQTASAEARVHAASLQMAPPQHDRVKEEVYSLPTFQLDHLDAQSCSNEILRAFSSLSGSDARHLLALLLENAAERGLPKLVDTLAESVGHLDSQQRRDFLRECFDFVPTSELQDALNEHDETNDAKRCQALVDDLSDVLQLQQEQEEVPETTGQGYTTGSTVGFHSAEARVCRKVHELVELLEDLAVEVSLWPSAHSALLSEELQQRLRVHECPTKREEKARGALRFDEPRIEEPEECQCTCGKHRLSVSEDEGARESARIPEEPGATDSQDNNAVKDRKPRRRSTLKRPLSGSSMRRKNAINHGSRLASSRRSSGSVSLRLFPLAEVCHISTAVLHLQFSRDAVESSTGTASVSTGGVSLLADDDRWAFLRPETAPLTFRALAKDYLVRKYGIKSIATMHTLQLERSLLHYGSTDAHTRCALFAWFLGADKPRAGSKDFAFRFFQQLVKRLLQLLAARKASRSGSVCGPSSSVLSPIAAQSKLQPLAYSTLISLWTEHIGDGEVATGRTVACALALEVCRLAFPAAMHARPSFTAFRERLYRRGLERPTMELESFLHEAMEVWQQLFDEDMAAAAATLDGEGELLDLDAVARCLERNGLEFTGGERLELFDVLAQEDGASAVPRRRLLHLLLESKYRS